MARKISFADLMGAVDSQRDKAIKLARLGSADAFSGFGRFGAFVEFDPESTVPRLRLRRDALLDEPPIDFDVDAEAYRIIQVADAAREDGEAQGSAANPDRPRVLAEGDSWCYMPSYCEGVPKAIGNHLVDNKTFRTRNIGWHGHTIVRILAARQYLSELRKRETQYFFLSAGGNDLVKQLKKGKLLHRYDAARPVNEYLTGDGFSCLNRIKNDYNALLSEVRKEFKDLKIVCFGYDYPRPLVGKGQHIGQHLVDLGIPESIADSVIRPVIELLGTRIKEAAINNGARYVDCLNATEGLIWWDDMHPHDDGFKALESKIAEEISNWQ